MEQFSTNKYEDPKVSDKELRAMTEMKAVVQEALMEKMYDHYPTNDEAMAWIEKYAEDLNFYFVEHPTTTMDTIAEIHKYLIEKTKVTLH